MSINSNIDKYKDRIAVLESKLASTTTNVYAKDSKTTIGWVVGGIAPLIYGFGLYFMGFSWLKKKDSDEIDYTKFFMVFAGLTGLTWGGLYIYVNGMPGK